MEHHNRSMQLRQFRIGDLANELRVKKFVIRFWEQEFGLQPDRSGGNHRFYTTEDLRVFSVIKDLLYNQGYTIEGAKKQLPVALAVQKRGEDTTPLTEQSQQVSSLISLQIKQVTTVEISQPSEADILRDAHPGHTTGVADVCEVKDLSVDAEGFAEETTCEVWSSIPVIEPVEATPAVVAPQEIVPAQEAAVVYHQVPQAAHCKPCETKSHVVEHIKKELEALKNRFTHVA